ncbi:MAG: RnfABCDGE type electron transport complex subunit D [Victivallales bacterium]|nr:RnfABCDGE type electron transport complex subunit D [Victivallales bacterium]
MSEVASNEIRMPDPENLIVSSSPHIHSNADEIWKIMLWVIVAMLPAAFAGLWFFGLQALRVMVLCVVFSVAFEMLWCRIEGKPVLGTVRDLSAVVTGMLLAFNLSAGVPWWICLVGAFIAIWLGKQVFGGLGSNPFNPALVARVGLLVAFPKIMTTWVPTRQMLAHAGKYTGFFDHSVVTAIGAGQLDGVTCATPLGVARNAPQVAAGIDRFAAVDGHQAIWNAFVGNVGGCLGETSALALLIGGIILISLKLIKWQVPVAYIGTVAIFTGIVHQVAPGMTPDALFHVVSGGLFLGAFFMATDMVTSPMTTLGAVIFGIGCGLITCLIRIWGGYPEGVSFSILFMNALVPLIDRFAKKFPFGYKALERGEAI